MIFIVGTDTDVGKTVVSALLLRAISERFPATYWKPVQSGQPGDTEVVARLCIGRSVDTLPPVYDLSLPASPHASAAAEGVVLSTSVLEEALSDWLRSEGPGRLVIELAGGLLVPYSLSTTQADWLARYAKQAGFVLVARTALGTLNHTLLTLEALRRREIEPAVVFLVGPEHRSNEETLRVLCRGPRVVHVPTFEPLAEATLDRWIAGANLIEPFEEVQRS